MKNENEIWISHISMHRWDDPALWNCYLSGVESILGDSLYKLDTNDPVRRKVTNVSEEGRYVTEFKEEETDRWLFGKFKKTQIELMIWYHREPSKSQNIIEFYIPESGAQKLQIPKLKNLFEFNNDCLAPFYAYADFKKFICSKKPCLKTLSLSHELLGVFWLTFFGKEYCEYFGRQKLNSLNGAADGPRNGISLSLSDEPSLVPLVRRSELEKVIGEDSFATSGDVVKHKELGQYVLTLEELRLLASDRED